MLELKNAMLQYEKPGGGLQMVLDHIDLKIEQGERWAVLVPCRCFFFL